MNTTERELLQDYLVIAKQLQKECPCNFTDRRVEGIEACLAKPVQELVANDMTWEDFSKIAYEASAEHRKDRLIASGFTNDADDLCVEFYELSHDKRDSWVHGCAVALAAYKKLTTQRGIGVLNDTN